MFSDYFDALAVSSIKTAINNLSGEVLFREARKNNFLLTADAGVNPIVVDYSSVSLAV